MSAFTKYAVLSLVARRPTYGYALMQQLRSWSVDPALVRSSSVYTALSRLERESLIEPRGPDVSNGTDRQPRLTYRATAAGVTRLERWLATRPASHDELRMRIALVRPQDLAALIDFVVAAEEECLRRLQARGSPELQELASRAVSWEALCGMVLASQDSVELVGRVRWLQGARASLEAMRAHARGLPASGRLSR